MKKRLFAGLLAGMMVASMMATSAFAVGTEKDGVDVPVRYRYETDAGIVETIFEDFPPVKVSYFKDEPACLTVDDPKVTVKDADEVMPASANVNKTLDLAVGKSYTYGGFYMGAVGPGDSHVGDMIDVTVNAISSGKYKVIIKGIKYSGFMGTDEEEVFSYESGEYSSAKTFSVPGEGGVAYSVTIVNTSAQRLKANLIIVTYQS